LYARSSMKNKIFNCIFYIVYIFIILLAVDYFAYYMVVHRYIPKVDDRRLTALEKKIGYRRLTQNSSFEGFAPAKKTGVVRIGCFGDSFTVGDGASKEYSYPDILQKLFHDRGYNVEVLNFGISGSGLSQAFIIWQAYNKSYDIDYTLLGPAGMLPDRDDSFNCWVNGAYFTGRASGREWAAKAMHGRFILKDGEPHFVEASGDTPQERFSRYTAFIPPWRYWRYDRHAPLVLSTLLFIIAPQNELKNPFYYSNNPHEISVLHSKLLSMMNNGSDDFVFLFNRLLNSAMEDISLPGDMNVSGIFSAWDFPYGSFEGHHSPQGYSLVARQYFDYLTGKSGSDLQTVALRPVEQSSFSGAIPPLRVGRDIALEFGGKDIGYFFDTRNLPPVNWDRDSKHTVDHDCLIGFKFGENLADTLFVPLNFIPRAGEKIRLRVYLPGKNIDFLLGDVRYTGRFAVSFVDSISGMVMNMYEKNWFSIRDIFNGAKAFKVLVGDKEIMYSKPDRYGNFNMYPRGGNIMFLAAKSTEFVDVDELPDTGDIFIKLYKKDGSFEKYPFARYFKQEVKVEFNSVIKKPVTKGVGQ